MLLYMRTAQKQIQKYDCHGTLQCMRRVKGDSGNDFTFWNRHHPPRCLIKGDSQSTWGFTDFTTYSLQVKSSANVIVENEKSSLLQHDAWIVESKNKFLALIIFWRHKLLNTAQETEKMVYFEVFERLKQISIKGTQTSQLLKVKNAN